MGRFSPTRFEKASTSRTSTPTRRLIGVVHTANQPVGTAETPPLILAMGSISNQELDGPMPKKGHQEDECIRFLGKDLKDILQPHEDALVVMLQIGGFDVRRVIIDQGSGIEIMYPDLYEG